MKAVYIAEDSGRLLVGGLVLEPGIEYSVSDGKVGYGGGATVIAKELAEKLAKRNILKLIDEPAAPATEAKAADKSKAETKPGA